MPKSGALTGYWTRYAGYNKYRSWQTHGQMRVEQIDFEAWERALPDSGFEVFHLPAALRVLTDHTDADLQLYAGYKGDQPVALLPVFVTEPPVGSVVQSPPASLGVPRLGPVLMPNSPKKRKREKLNQTFTEEVAEQFSVDSPLTLLRMVCNTAYTDPRPYSWLDLRTETLFTYCLDVGATDLETIRADFSSSLRRDIRDAEDLPVTVEREGLEGVREIHADTVARYEEQDESYGQSWEYVCDLAEALDERCQAYVVRGPDGEYVSGITVLYSNDMAYFWGGGTRGTYEGTSVNSLVHWRIIEDIAAGDPIDSVDRYDLMGANTERLCRYKSKFGADLVPYYLVETEGASMDVAKRAYQLVKQ